MNPAHWWDGDWRAECQWMAILDSFDFLT
jgi:hypothetical protein